MRLGLSIGYSRAHLDLPVALVQRAEELGYDTVWSAEAYGSDAVSPLAYLAAVTKRIKLGTEISLPYTGEGAMGVGKPLKSILHMNPSIPIWLGTETDAMVRLTAEIADGWLALGMVPGSLDYHLPLLEEGFRRAERATGRRKTRADFTIQASVHVDVDEDVKAALARIKPETALYVGGMGHRDKNFHKDMMTSRGFGEAANRIQELYLAHRKDEAIAAVPDEFVDMKSLVGPPARIRQRYRAWEEMGVDAITIRSRQPAAIDVMAEAARLNRPGAAA